MIYADPSFLFSFYAWDGNSARAAAVYAKDRRRPIFFTPWQAFEVRNAVRLTVGRLTRAKEPLRFQTGNVIKAIREDLSTGRLRHIEPDWRETLRLAEELSEKHTAPLGTTAIDTWHVAAAVLVHADVFWTFDGSQRKLAMATGRIPRVPNLSKQ